MAYLSRGEVALNLGFLQLLFLIVARKGDGRYVVVEVGI